MDELNYIVFKPTERTEGRKEPKFQRGQGVPQRGRTQDAFILAESEEVKHIHSGLRGGKKNMLLGDHR